VLLNKNISYLPKGDSTMVELSHPLQQEKLNFCQSYRYPKMWQLQTEIESNITQEAMKIK